MSNSNKTNEKSKTPAQECFKHIDSGRAVGGDASVNKDTSEQAPGGTHASETLWVKCFLCGGEFRIDRDLLAGGGSSIGVGVEIKDIYIVGDVLTSVNIKVEPDGGDVCRRCAVLMAKITAEKLIKEYSH